MSACSEDRSALRRELRLGRLRSVGRDKAAAAGPERGSIVFFLSDVGARRRRAPSAGSNRSAASEKKVSEPHRNLLSQIGHGVLGRSLLHIGSVSASPTACPLCGHGRAGTRNDRLSEKCARLAHSLDHRRKKRYFLRDPHDFFSATSGGSGMDRAVLARTISTRAFRTRPAHVHTHVCTS